MWYKILQIIFILGTIYGAIGFVCDTEKGVNDHVGINCGERDAKVGRIAVQSFFNDALPEGGGYSCYFLDVKEKTDDSTTYRIPKTGCINKNVDVCNLKLKEQYERVNPCIQCETSNCNVRSATEDAKNTAGRGLGYSLILVLSFSYLANIMFY